jgi:hypothetical protein
MNRILLNNRSNGSAAIIKSFCSKSTIRTMASTPFKDRFVRMDNSKFNMQTQVYPTPGNGHDFKMNIFGMNFHIEDIMALQDSVWNKNSFLPNMAAAPLPGSSILSDLSNIAQGQAFWLKDKTTPGLLQKNELRNSVRNEITSKHFTAAMNLLKSFKNETNIDIKNEYGQQISNLAFWCQWLIRGYLFEGKLHYEVYTEDVIPANLAKIAFAANAALGRHQIEFVYDDYTLKAANFPKNFNIDDVNYDSQKEILEAVAKIDTHVGFNDMTGGEPEHNFRHNHSLMEYQMIRAFEGVEEILAGNVKGWDKIVESARRSNKVFKTMLQNTPPLSYPLIRLPIKGVRGACGSVYQPHGVFYEGLGNETYVKDGKTLTGIYIDDEWGQTGANSSMYKYLDILIGVAHVRQAFGTDPIMIKKMANVFDGTIDSSELGSNPIDSMQRAFDLFTRPVKHMKILVDTSARISDSKILDDKNPEVLLQRLRLAYWVAEHRITHGKYVLKSIYQTEPVGGQSRADGTGGSTPPFLKVFLDQTLGPARGIIIDLLLKPELLTPEESTEVSSITGKLDEFEARMTMVRDKGNQLEYEEKNRH